MLQEALEFFQTTSLLEARDYLQNMSASDLPGEFCVWSGLGLGWQFIVGFGRFMEQFNIRRQ